jgi:stage IV sporulation protein FB
VHGTSFLCATDSGCVQLTTIHRGVRISVHPLFVWFVAAAWLGGAAVDYGLVFFWIVVHECGHIIAARVCRWRVRSMVLTPIGVVLDCDDADIVSMRSELFVVCSGLVVTSFVLGVLTAGVALDVVSAQSVQQAIDTNVRLLLLNSLPIWPLDGGRLLRLGCALCMPYVWAIRTSALFGIATSCALLGWGCYALAKGMLPLEVLLLAMFVFFDNVHEWRYAMLRVWRSLLAAPLQRRPHTIYLAMHISLRDVPMYVRRGRPFVVQKKTAHGVETMTQEQWWKRFSDCEKKNNNNNFVVRNGYLNKK